MGNPLVVVAEDDAALRLLVAEILRTLLDAQVVGAADGERCLRVLGMVRPHVLLLDVDMPLLDGLSIARRLRADPAWAGLPILAMSGATAAADALAAGCDAFIAKPFRPAALADAVRRLLPAELPPVGCAAH